MKKKLTKSQLKKQRKKIKPSNVIENRLLSAFRKVFSFKTKDSITLDELEDQVRKFNYSKVDNYTRRIAKDILNRNNEGFINIVTALVQGSKGYTSKTQQELNKALQETIKQRKIYEPLMKKFEYNVGLIKNVPTDVVNELRSKYAQGVSFRGSDIENYLEKRLGNRAKLIIRTESSKLNSAVTEMRAKNLGIVAFIWSTSEDQRVRPSHKMMDGVLVFYSTRLSLDKMIGFAGEYPNCFPGNELVNPSYGIDKLYRRKYTGDLVNVVLENGTTITATPNHPFLSSMGWKAINSFNVGEQLLEVRHNNSKLVSTQYDDDKCKPTFENLFSAFSEFGVPTVKISGMSKGEFHGDGIVNEDIDIIDINGFLSNNIMPIVFQVFRELDFKMSGDTVSTSLLSTECPMTSLTMSVNPTPNGIMCGSSIFGIIFGRAFGHHKSISSTVISHLNTILCKNSSNNTSTNFIQSSKFWTTHSFIVLLDYLIRRQCVVDGITGCDIREFTWDEPTFTQFITNSIGMNVNNTTNFSETLPFVVKPLRIIKKFVTYSSTHIYNLQSSHGYYTIKNNICQHNCRCVGLPVVTLEDIKFPVKVAIGNLSIETRKNKAVITSGQIKTFTKTQFLERYGNLFK